MASGHNGQVLHLLRGCHFTRLDDSFIEVFVRGECDVCKASISLGSQILKETDDARLAANSIYPGVKPESGTILVEYGKAFCGACLGAWIANRRAPPDCTERGSAGDTGGGTQ